MSELVYSKTGSAYVRSRGVPVPESIDDLQAQLQSTVKLPLSLAWSGMKEFNLDDPYFEILFYERVLNEARSVQVLQQFLNGDRLRVIWNKLYPSLFVKSAWEDRFPELRES